MKRILVLVCTALILRHQSVKAQSSDPIIIIICYDNNGNVVPCQTMQNVRKQHDLHLK